MKKTILSLFITAIAVSILSGCIQETFPMEAAATSEQMAQSSAAMQGSVDGLVAQAYQPYYFYGSDNQLEFDISYAGILITWARMTNDLVNKSATIGYDWWTGYCGAYGYSMSSSYNTRPRAAEVLITADGKDKLIRRRECFEDLCALFPEDEE